MHGKYIGYPYSNCPCLVIYVLDVIDAYAKYIWVKL